MRIVAQLLLVTAIFHQSFAPPVTQQKNGHKEDSDEKDDLDNIVEYRRYLKEVVAVLESDPDFRNKLENAEETDIRTGKIAEHLDFVHHNVRSQLDEIKRKEMERLRHLATQEYELTNNIDTIHLKVSTDHLDQDNPHTFEIEDLKRLIKKTTADLAEADRKRKEEFKKYEMEKEFEKHQKLEAMSESDKKEFEEQQKRAKKEHDDHPKVHHPGSKQQLEEVWEKQDHMEQEFNPKVFFMMHDVDSNGVWDADEVKALFVKELDKMYKAGANTTDIRERMEEMERMREHVFSESDTNRDGLIDFNEFLLQTKRTEFERDPGWKGIDENEVYSKKEYEEFEKQRMEEIKYLQERGLLDVHGRPIQGAYQQQAYRQLPPQYQTSYYQQHPYEIPHEYLQPLPPHPEQVHQQGNPQQMPPQGHMPQYGQMPPQAQYHQGQMHPQAQYHQGQMPPQAQYQQEQVPLQAQYQQAQIPPQAVYQQGQMSQQGHIPLQGQPQQGQVLQQGQVHQTGQVNQQGQVPQHVQPQQPGHIPQQGYVSQGNAGQMPQVQVPLNQANQAPNGAQGHNVQPQHAANNVQPQHAATNVQQPGHN